ncbi:hypothetical protein D6C79_07994 [Aureobasidium pullulans]|nr:hypothetical protein D6C79_07994 [Aureobasidium pullulans]
MSGALSGVTDTVGKTGKGLTDTVGNTVQGAGKGASDTVNSATKGVSDSTKVQRWESKGECDTDRRAGLGDTAKGATGGATGSSGGAAAGGDPNHLGL